MPKTVNSSSSRRSSSVPGLVRVPLARLRAHPANPNRMDEEQLTKLASNINREGRYPPLIVRPDPETHGCYQVLDGHQRWQVLERLGRRDAECYLWPCDDETALVLLATLNRLAGQDDPRKRAELIAELSRLATIDELAQLLPEDAGEIQRSLEFVGLDLDRLLADLEASADAAGNGLRAITFAVSPEDERAIESAVARAAAGLAGANRRGRALGQIARRYVRGERA